MTVDAIQHRDDVLVIRATSAPPREAVAAWTELHARYGWDHLPHALVRFLPMVYLNIRGGAAAPDLDRLRGVYRASWASNLTRVGVIRPVLEQLHRRGVEATVIKGGSLCILTNQWGFRRMGDLDVVLPSSSASIVSEVLQDSSFDRTTPASAGVHSDVEGPWQGPGDALIDIHFSDRWSRYTGLTEGHTQERESQGYVWSVPTPETALAIALEHGQIGAGVGDVLQTTLDLQVLSPMVDRAVTARLLDRLDLSSTAVWHAMALREALGESPSLWLTQLEVTTHRRPRVTVASRRWGLVLARRIREWGIRRLRHEDRVQLWHRRHEIGLPYWIWLESGMLGPMERLLSRTGAWPNPARHTPRLAGEPPAVPPQADVSALPRRDLRARIDLGSGARHARLRIRVPEGLEHRRFLFLGERCMGLIDPAVRPVIDVDLDDDVTGMVDVSFRLYWDVEPREDVRESLRVEWVTP